MRFSRAFSSVAKLSAELKEKNRELTRMDKLKDEFLANTSHELRTPLNSIIGFSEMMSSGVMGGLPKQYAEYSTFITSSGHHLLNIINDILDLSKIEADMLQLDESEVNLRREISEVVMMIKDQAFKNNNQLLNKLDPTVELKLNGDRMRIKQVLLNVISNAVKFTHDGTISVDVIVADNAITLTITDTGIGMTDADIELALRPFGQVDGHHLNKRYEGTGLGLPLADKLMQMHDAKLSIESVPGEGTTVLLAFPQNRTLSAYTKLH